MRDMGRGSDKSGSLLGVPVEGSKRFVYIGVSIGPPARAYGNPHKLVVDQNYP